MFKNFHKQHIIFSLKYLILIGILSCSIVEEIYAQQFTSTVIIKNIKYESISYLYQYPKYIVDKTLENYFSENKIPVTQDIMLYGDDFFILDANTITPIKQTNLVYTIDSLKANRCLLSITPFGIGNKLLFQSNVLYSASKKDIENFCQMIDFLCTKTVQQEYMEEKLQLVITLKNEIQILEDNINVAKDERPNALNEIKAMQEELKIKKLQYKKENEIYSSISSSSN
jgi:hypothetical protein